MNRKSLEKEKFIINFCKKKGWDKDKLSTKQMLSIVNHKDFKKIK